MFKGIWLVASEDLTQAETHTRDIEAGERFEIPRIHAGALLAMRKATIAPKLPPAPVPESPAPRRRRARKLNTTAIDAETTEIISGPPEDTVSEALKRAADHLRYSRRDLEAEE
jgi:hypothetical protein